MMRKFWSLLMAGSVGAMSVQAAPADIHELLVGSYTAGTSEGIYRLQFDSSTGQFSGKPVLAAKTANPSWLTISKDQKQLFVVNENGPGQADPVGRVSSYAIDPKTRELSLINQGQGMRMNLWLEEENGEPQKIEFRRFEQESAESASPSGARHTANLRH